VMGLKVLMLGSGVADFSSVGGRLAMRGILRLAHVVCVRDEASARICRALASSANFEVTGDLVPYLATAISGPRARAAPEVVLLSIQPSVTEQKGVAGEAARQALLAVIEDALERGMHCRLLAFETKPVEADGRDDRAAWLNLASRPLRDHPDRVQITAVAGHLAPLLNDLGPAAVHFGMRYHGHVLSALAGVPFAGLAHDLKIREVCRSFGMPCLDVAQVDASAAVAAVQLARRTPVLTEAQQELHRHAVLNEAALGRVLKELEP
jgi:polysaccharide pyruvyl transferase WcaK-like protein